MLPAEDVEVYVAFEHREVQQLSSGEVVEVLNRAVAIPVGELIVASPAIVIVDGIRSLFKLVQKVFFNDNVDVVWGTILDSDQLDSINCSILFAVRAVKIMNKHLR